MILKQELAKLSANANGIIDAPSKAIAPAPIAIGPIIIPNPNGTSLLEYQLQLHQI